MILMGCNPDQEDGVLNPCSSEPSVQADSRPTLHSAGSRRSGSGCVAAFIGPLGSLQSIILPLHPRFYRGVAPSVRPSAASRRESGSRATTKTPEPD